MKRIAYTLSLALLFAVPFAGYAATPDQMEQARVQAFKACLRNMNDASGYLDDLHPKSMAELEKKLKDKEKDNIGKLKGIDIPSESEYAGWDKAQFEQFWVGTFVNKAGVKSSGFCKGQVKNAISGIKVTKAEKPVAEEKEKAAAGGNAPAESAKAVPVEQQEVAVERQTAEVQTQDIPAVATEDVKPAAPEESKKNSNTASIVVLCILVLVVIALVGYALNVMKKNKVRQAQSPRAARRKAPRYEEDSYRPAATVQSDPEEESPFAAYSSAPEPEPVRPADPKDREIERLRSEIAALQSQMKGRPSAPAASAFGAAPRRNPRIIYLAQANSDGVFARADARYNRGNSIFKLVTTDGVSGSFSVIEDPTVFELALMMPTDFLVNACTGRNLQLSEGARIIVNEASGTALFEDGRWRVSRKAQIRYSR